MMRNFKVLLAFLAILSSTACEKDRFPFFEIHYWEINNFEAQGDSYVDTNDLVKIKVSAGTTDNSNTDRKISHFTFGYTVDGAQGDAVGEVNQDADNISVTYILDLQEMFKNGSIYNCKGAEDIELYLEMVDYNGNSERY